MHIKIALLIGGATILSGHAQASVIHYEITGNPYVFSFDLDTSEPPSPFYDYDQDGNPIGRLDSYAYSAVTNQSLLWHGAPVDPKQFILPNNLGVLVYHNLVDGSSILQLDESVTWTDPNYWSSLYFWISAPTDLLPLGDFTGSASITKFTQAPDVYISTKAWFAGDYDPRPLFGSEAYNMTSVTLSAVPEPASWLLMIAGFGGLGTVLRRAKARHDRHLTVA